LPVIIAQPRSQQRQIVQLQQAQGAYHHAAGRVQQHMDEQRHG